MSKNFEFCNYDFLNLFWYNPNPFYNQFYLEKNMNELIDSMGDHPDFHVVFKYNPEKRIRATFIIFDDVENMDVKCICTLFHGDRSKNYCYFYEVYEDSSIGCIQVVKDSRMSRVVTDVDIGDDIDVYFEKLCARLGKPEYESTTMLHYKEGDDCFRLLDMILTELPGRCDPLLGGEPDIEVKTIGDNQYLFYKSRVDNNFLVARTLDGKNPSDIFLSDIDVLK